MIPIESNPKMSNFPVPPIWRVFGWVLSAQGVTSILSLFLFLFYANAIAFSFYGPEWLAVFGIVFFGLTLLFLMISMILFFVWLKRGAFGRIKNFFLTSWIIGTGAHIIMLVGWYHPDNIDRTSPNIIQPLTAARNAHWTVFLFFLVLGGVCFFVKQGSEKAP